MWNVANKSFACQPEFLKIINLSWENVLDAAKFSLFLKAHHTLLVINVLNTFTPSHTFMCIL